MYIIIINSDRIYLFKFIKYLILCIRHRELFLNASRHYYIYLQHIVLHLFIDIIII